LSAGDAGLVLDGSGFVRRSQTFAGNVSEAGTLETMLQDLNAPQGALVVMDAGIATEANIQWLRETGYGYLVVSRERSRQFNADDTVSLETAAQETVRCQKVAAEDGKKFGSIAIHPAENKRNRPWRNASPVVLKPDLTP